MLSDSSDDPDAGREDGTSFTMDDAKNVAGPLCVYVLGGAVLTGVLFWALAAVIR